MRISDWSSDVCSSDLSQWSDCSEPCGDGEQSRNITCVGSIGRVRIRSSRLYYSRSIRFRFLNRSEEHTSELQSLMRISYAVFCLKKNNHYTSYTTPQPQTPNNYRLPHRRLTPH